MNAKLLDSICAAVLCIILTLGLWPFHAPENQVTWLRERSGLRFGRNGTAIGSRAFEMPDPRPNDTAGSLEIWLQPRRMWDSGTFLAFYASEDPLRFSLRQMQTDLRLQAAIRGERTRPASLYVDDVFYRRRPTFITITSHANGIAVYVDGAPALRAPRFQLRANQFTGRIILGDSAGQTDSWKGVLLGLAIYSQELTPAQVLRHYETWSRAGRPEIQADDRNAALYLFDERGGNVVHDRAGLGGDLSIPERYMVLDQIFLEPFWTEFAMTRSYWSAVAKNIVGFIPFGFCLCARLSLGRRAKRAALTTVLLGMLVSLTIEILQAYLPTRDSGTTDIITNTLGTWAGATLFRTMSDRGWFAMLRHRSGTRAAGAGRG
jgi:hypothetical protein